MYKRKPVPLEPFWLAVDCNLFEEMVTQRRVVRSQCMGRLHDMVGVLTSFSGHYEVLSFKSPHVYKTTLIRPVLVEGGKY